MDTITNANHALACMILNTLQVACVSGDKGMADSMGMANEDVERLVRLSSVDLAHLSYYSDQFIQVTIDPDKLRQLTQLSRSKVKEDTLIDTTLLFQQRHQKFHSNPHLIVIGSAMPRMRILTVSEGV
ncbi:MAG: hypothetical protein GKR95_23965 [Gammaproteobacteria bacterium]|nr:hypothetical protein [Gammaproteobacteria bacterium]